jgi:hypothetical protein
LPAADRRAGDGLAIFAAQVSGTLTTGNWREVAGVGVLMLFDDEIGNGRPQPAMRGSASNPSSRLHVAGLRLALVCFGLAALAGCTNGAGSLLVDPGRYSAYHCNDLAARAKVLAAREKDLRDLIERANQGGGGAVIGSLAYRTDYESVRSEEKLLQSEAVDKNCNFTPQFQSDQIIR